MQTSGFGDAKQLSATTLDNHWTRCETEKLHLVVNTLVRHKILEAYNRSAKNFRDCLLMVHANVPPEDPLKFFSEKELKKIEAAARRTARNTTRALAGHARRAAAAAAAAAAAVQSDSL